ncbi:NADH-quinone oxidoreductase subunit J [Desulfuromonas sp. AOP6]|uniref:NADH-quinone oxidoreductase subunit J n=1 Tax=Desulfuromonas sp. AOP6 TaxID=1566351 RepID=UPI00128567AE|nr:NADH-quinone oxidoreductase subunit J [Desulfuromonas sp. AOP6]BCA78366.1 NADH dehydrogenase subunit J [Desulfuromonas sp. AOP6]
MELFFFSLVAFVAVLSGVMVVTCKSPINSALSLVMTFICLATFYIMLNAPFMAAIQIMVYAGAIIVLIIFVIMLLNLGTATMKKTSHSLAWSGLVALLLFIQAAVFLKNSNVAAQTGEITNELVNKVGHTELLGLSLFTEFLLPFEIASILLLVAIVGALVLAKKEV